MAINLSIKNVPDEIADRLRQQAAARHRSLQGELLAILEEAVAVPRKLSIEQAHQLARESGLETPDEAREIVRADRDAR